jgi:glycosyltransferase involved in cell wall biosynthesis
MIGKCSVPKEKWRILYNGVDTSLFKPSNKIRGKMIWASSHDRGLHWLLEAFPKIKKESPHANLHIFYDFNGVNVFSKWENLDKNTQSGRYGNELGQRSRYVLEAIRRLKNYDVFVHESVSRKRIIEEMSTSEVLAYPLDPIHYTETFGVTVLEACASGVVPVLCTSDAFGELWGNVSETVLPPYTEHKEEFIDKTVKLLNDDEYRANMSIKCVRESQKFDWSVLSKNLNECIESNGVSGLPIIC